MKIRTILEIRIAPFLERTVVDTKLILTTPDLLLIIVTNGIVFTAYAAFSIRYDTNATWRVIVAGWGDVIKLSH